MDQLGKSTLNQKEVSYIEEKNSLSHAIQTIKTTNSMQTHLLALIRAVIAILSSYIVGRGISSAKQHSYQNVYPPLPGFACLYIKKTLYQKSKTYIL